MKGIRTLIKLRKKALDEQARQKALLTERIMLCEQRIHELEQTLKSEEAMAASSPELSFLFTSYAEHNHTQQTQFRQIITQAETQIHRIETQMQHLFGELKQYEIALERYKTQAANDAKAQETKQLDDIALRLHIRKQEGD